MKTKYVLNRVSLDMQGWLFGAGFLAFWLGLRSYSSMVLKYQMKAMEKLEPDFSQRCTMEEYKVVDKSFKKINSN